jgi:hypothetical protein
MAVVAGADKGDAGLMRRCSRESPMAIHDLEPASASPGHDEAAAVPMLSNSVLARTYRPPGANRLLTGFLAGLFAAAAVIATGYWAYRQVQPGPLFAPASASPEYTAVPAATAGGAPERQQ